MTVRRFDHVAIPTARPKEMLRFYAGLGFSVPSYEEWTAVGIPFFSIQFGDNKINVHTADLWQDQAFDLRGPTAQPGCGDFCFVWDGDLESLLALLDKAKAEVVEGPIAMQGGRGGGTDRGTSVYTRDPDSNLLEFIVYDD